MLSRSWLRGVQSHLEVGTDWDQPEYQRLSRPEGRPRLESSLKFRGGGVSESEDLGRKRTHERV